jgi:hypothetical protein
MTLDKALALAVSAHTGQTDKGFDCHELILTAAQQASPSSGNNLRK